MGSSRADETLDDVALLHLAPSAQRATRTGWGPFAGAMRLHGYTALRHQGKADPSPEP